MPGRSPPHYYGPKPRKPKGSTMKKKPGKDGKKCRAQAEQLVASRSSGGVISFEDAIKVTAEYLGLSEDEAILHLMMGVAIGKLSLLPDLATEAAAGTA